MLSWVCSITLPTARTLTVLQSQTLLGQHMCWGRVEGKLGRVSAHGQCGSHRDRLSSCHVAAGATMLWDQDTRVQHGSP